MYLNESVLKRGGTLKVPPTPHDVPETPVSRKKQQVRDNTRTVTSFAQWSDALRQRLN